MSGRPVRPVRCRWRRCCRWPGRPAGGAEEAESPAGRAGTLGQDPGGPTPAAAAQQQGRGRGEGDSRDHQHRHPGPLQQLPGRRAEGVAEQQMRLEEQAAPEHQRRQRPTHPDPGAGRGHDRHRPQPRVVRPTTSAGRTLWPATSPLPSRPSLPSRPRGVVDDPAPPLAGSATLPHRGTRPRTGRVRRAPSRARPACRPGTARQPSRPAFARPPTSVRSLSHPAGPGPGACRPASGRGRRPGGARTRRPRDGAG
jgi:hypothetical protein